MANWRLLVGRPARKAIRPAWRRVWTRIESRIAPIESRVGSLEGRVGSLDGRVGSLDGAWNQLTPAFLNAVSTVGAFAHELQQGLQKVALLRSEVDAVGVAVDAVNTELQAHSGRADAAREKLRTEFSSEAARIWDRLEFIRREILFEFSSGRGPGAGNRNSESPTNPRILSSEKLASSRANGSGLRVNLGCGHVPLDDYLNVDQRELPGVDIVADVGNLPLDPGTVSEIASAHLLEHFPQEMLRRNLLPYWHGLLVPGGRFRAVVPDGAAMLSGIAAKSYEFEDFREVLFGAQDYDGDFHFNLFTPESLTSLLREAGFRDVAVPIAARRNGKCFEFEIHAHC